jgi:putative membrane protein
MTLQWGPSNRLDEEEWYIQFLAVSFLVYAVPAWVGAVVTHGWLSMLKGHTYLYRTSIYALTMTVVIGLLLVVGYLLSLVNEDIVPLPEYFLFALSATAMFLHLLNLMTSTSRWVLALPVAVMQPVLGMAGILYLYYHGWDWAADPWTPILLVVALLVLFIGVGHGAMWAGTRTMARSYGVDGTSVFRAFLEHWVTGGDAGQKEIEGFFRSFSEPSIVKSEVISFREKGGPPIATLVIPTLHPGPWGELGGSDMPKKVSTFLKGEHGQVFTFHGASDHDLNPADLEEVEKLGRAINGALDGLDLWTDQASASVRVVDGTDALAQAFNGAVMAATTSAPHPTDDVDLAVGYTIEQEMEKIGASPGAFIDCHNCLLPGAGHVPFGTPKARRIQERVVEATKKALEAQRAGFKVGVGHVPNEGELVSMGPMGIQALVVEVEEQRTAWVLTDGNNMACGLRERARDSLLEKVDEAEVLTTDNHIVNVTVGGFNPIGEKDDQALFVRRCRDAVDLALEDLREAEVAATRVEVGDVLVWGKGNTVRMTTNINTSVTTSKTALMAAVTIAFIIGFGLMRMV